MKTRFRAVIIFVTFFLVACLGAAAARQCPSEYLDCSSSGKLKVKGEHVGTQGIISFNVDPSLKGPIQIVVTNGSNSTTFTKALERGRDDYSVSIALRPGKNSIVVKDEKDASETTRSFDWEGEADRAGTLGFAAQQPSASSKIAVAADRLDSNSNVAHLRISVDPSVKGYEVLVTDESQTDPLKKEVFHRTRTNIERGDDVLFENVNLLGTGERQVRVRPLRRDGSVDDSAENTVTLMIPAASAANLTMAESAREQEVPEYDWGRVRGYFASGVMFSKERDNFSKSDIFLSFTLDKNYLKKDWGWFKDINTFFNARITALPVTVPSPTTTPAEGATPTPTPTPCGNAECDSFVSSQKAAVLEVGVYLPMYWNFMTWTRDVPRIGRSPRKEGNALFIAPMAKGGVATITGTSTTAEAARFGGDDVFNFFSFGTRIGHFRTHTSRNLAPELISWLDLSVGRWEQFEFTEPVLDAAGRTLKDAAGDDIKVRRRPWRYEARGALRIPETPFLIGFEGNFGKGPDDLRFIFGTRFDIAKVLKTLKVADANDSLGRSQPSQ